MANNLVIKFKGVERVIQLNKEMDNKLSTNIQRALKRSGLLVEGEAKKVTPVLTGTLRRSIRSQWRPFRVTVSPHVEYASWIHDGVRRGKNGATIRLKGRGKAGTPAGGKPFMDIGVDNAEGDIKREFMNAVDRSIN